MISPSFPVLFYRRKGAARWAEQVMNRLGLRVSYGTNAAEITDDGRSAGTPRQRASDLMEAFTDPSVDVVFSASGGATTQELIPLLDTERLRSEPKAFVGTSDNAWLNMYLWQEVGLSSYYGTTYLGEMCEFHGPFPETLESFQRALMSTDDLVCRPVRRRTNEFTHYSNLKGPARRLNVEGGWHWVRPGRGRGPLIGGEIGMLSDLADHCGLDVDGCVLFWDLSPQNTGSMQSQLTYLADRVSLNRLAGMMVGPDVRHTPEAWADMVADALSAVLPAATFPVVVNADVGHLEPKWVVPYGREVVLDSSTGVVFPRSP